MGNFNKPNLVKLHSLVLNALMIAVLCSCGAYKQNIMFKTSSDSKIVQEKQIAESNYVIQKNDLLTVEVFANHGVKVVDAKSESLKDSPGQSTLQSDLPKYLVDKEGIVKLPLLQAIKLEGLTVRQAEEILQKEYNVNPYIEPLVVLRIVNKRVTVLGSPGGKVIPLLDENIRLTEVLALAGGINLDGKAKNIRVLRGSQIFIADFSTVEGYLRDDMLIQSGDIVYVEPLRRPFLEGLQNYGPLFSIITGLATLAVIIVNQNQN
jgi:polysaccharide export outer membrane protein